MHTANNEPTADVRARLAMAAGLPEYPSAAGIVVREHASAESRADFWLEYRFTAKRATVQS